MAAIEERLLDAALAEFLSHGYGGASLTRIVKAAGVSKTTLWSRFPSKGELFRAIIDKQIANFSAVTTLRPRSRRLDLERGLRSYASRTLEISLEGDILQVNRLIYSESHRFPELGAAAAERTSIGVRQVADFVIECAAADGVPCRDPMSVGSALVFMLRGWYVDRMLHDNAVAASVREAWVRRMVRILVAGRADW